MKNKYIGLIALFLVLALAIGFYFFRQNQLSGNFNGNGMPFGQEKAKDQLEKGQNGNKLATNDFEIVLPDGWKQTAAGVGISAMAVNENEQIIDEAAQRINFKTYAAVSYDTVQGKSLGDYFQTVKEQLDESIPGAVFSQENGTKINDREAWAAEVNFNQKEIDFKVLIIAIRGEGDDVWLISFNTLENSWEDYRQVFADMADSFTLKS